MQFSERMSRIQPSAIRDVQKKFLRNRELFRLQPDCLTRIYFRWTPWQFLRKK